MKRPAKKVKKSRPTLKFLQKPTCGDRLRRRWNDSFLAGFSFTHDSGTEFQIAQSPAPNELIGATKSEGVESK